jgi:hypothetical protein
MSELPAEGQLRGIGVRLDPQEILIAPYQKDGLMWGYTIIDKTTIPTMYIMGEWKEVVPEGVWLQMLENWNNIPKTAKNIVKDHPEYLDYPEIKELFK